MSNDFADTDIDTSSDTQQRDIERQDIVFHLRALSRLVYVITDEEDVFLRKFKRLIRKYGANTWVFSMSFGLVELDKMLEDWKSRAHAVNTNVANIHDVLDTIYTQDPRDRQNFWIILDPEIHLQDPMVQRRLLDINNQLRTDDENVKVIIFLSSKRYIPPKLSMYIQLSDEPPLSDEDIVKALSGPCEKLQAPIPDDAAALFRGMNGFEIQTSVAQSAVLTLQKSELPPTHPIEVEPEHIHMYRKNKLKKTGLLDLIDTRNFNHRDLGGVERFKVWANEMRAVFTEEGRHYGLKVPKGVLLTGVWGTGKSLSAKVLSNAWGLPLVLLEMGKLRSSGVGDTEQNVYYVLKTIEAVAPCIVFIDEAEKSLSGGQSSALSDSGTTARSLGIFSTWIQETSLPITLVLTANRLSTLPVEFVNRMDERWFFDLPSPEERIEILKIHLRKNKQSSDDYNLVTLADASKDMVGREIQQSIDAALLKSFHARSPRLDQDILENVLRRKPRIVKTMSDEVREITDWVGFDVDADDGIKARFASRPNRAGGKFSGGAFEIIQGGAGK
jgi:AAA+ superfamily predicted ATPase